MAKKLKKQAKASKRGAKGVPASKRGTYQFLS